MIILSAKFTKNIFSESDFKLLSVMSNCLSGALKNSELLLSLSNQKNKLNKTLFELETFFDTGKVLQDSDQDDQLYEEILYRAISLMNVSGGIMYLTNSESPICSLAAALHPDEQNIKTELFTKNYKYFKECVNSKSSMFLNNINDKKLVKLDWENILISPLRGSNNTHGFLILGPKETIDGIIPFSDADTELIDVISLQAGIALENKLLIQDLEKEQKSIKNIIRSIGNGIITLNLLGEVDSFNKNALEILEKVESDLLNHPYLFVFQDNSKIIDLITKCIESGLSINEPNIVLKVNNKDKNINFTTRPLIDDNDEAIGLIIGIENITEELRVKNTFKRYVSESIVDQIIDDKLELGMGGKLKEVTILFSDIRGFTALSEQLKPDQVVSLLNEYYTEMIEVVFRYNGTLDKIVGDELMVVFGAPLEIKDAPNAAIKTAIEMQKKLSKLNKTMIRNLSIGIGINSGVVISGNIGSEVRSDYTVIGDNVNLAARLCSHAQSTEILISQNTHKEINNEVNVQVMPSFQAKGKKEKIKNWKIIY